MKSFVKMTLAVIAGLILTGILFFVIMLSVVSGIAAAGSKPSDIPEKSILVLRTGTMTPDRTSTNPFALIDPISMSFKQNPGLNDILKNLQKAAKDDDISGILIENGVMPSGWAIADELQQALTEFKKSGKFVYSYSDYILMQESYFISTAADAIWLSPTSMFYFQGLAAEVTFYHKALEKLDVDIQIIRHGKFKGAVEPTMLDKMSDENRLQVSAYAGSIWNHVVRIISETRGVSEKRVMQLADSLAGYDLAKMTNEGLIDGAIYRDQLEDSIRKVARIEEKKKINYVSMTKYTNVPDKQTHIAGKPKIAVVYAEGNIVMGDGDNTNIGGNKYAEELRKVRLDSTIRAVVFRINSRGGVAIASDIIWREVELTSKVKPVVVSMGNYAASGGYYISAPADKILASPATLTGSIGVFVKIPNIGSLLDKKLGITTDVVRTNPHADVPSITRPLNSYEIDILQANAERTYNTFTSIVADGRGMTQAEVDSVGQGRVWSGADATGRGLVDSLGGLNDAIKEAASLAGLEEYRIIERPMAEDYYTALLKDLSGELKIRTIRNELGEASRYYFELKEVLSSEGVQALMPCFIEIH
jgi:protease-4